MGRGSRFDMISILPTSEESRAIITGSCSPSDPTNTLIGGAVAGILGFPRVGQSMLEIPGCCDKSKKDIKAIS